MSAETDLVRLNDLVQRHGLAYRKRGLNSYYFDDRTSEDAFSDGCIFIARGLREALAFVKGFDRARSPSMAVRSAERRNAEELRKLGMFTAALRKSGLADA